MNKTLDPSGFFICKRRKGTGSDEGPMSTLGSCSSPYTFIGYSPVSRIKPCNQGAAGSGRSLILCYHNTLLYVTGKAGRPSEGNVPGPLRPLLRAVALIPPGKDPPQPMILPSPMIGSLVPALPFDEGHAFGVFRLQGSSWECGGC